jgi:hypothetical protein
MSIFFQDEGAGEPGGEAPGGWLAAIVEAWDGPIYVGGPDFRIRFMNRRFIAALGRDATGDLCFSALHGREEPCPWCSLEVFAGRKVSGFFQHPVTGRCYQVSNVPLPLPDGAFAKVAFIRETTEPDTLVRDLPVFRNIVDRLSDAILFFDPENGRVLYANELACQGLGYNRETLLGMQFPDFAEAPPSLGDWHALPGRIDREGIAVFEARHRRRDGTFFDVEIKASRLQAGLQRFIVAVVRDITGRKEAEARLIEERNKVEAIMAAMGDGITVQDRDFRIIYQNEVLIRRRGNRYGEPCYRVYAGRDEVCDDCAAQKSFADGRVHRRPFTTTSPSGEIFHLEITACPLHDAAGEVVACVEVVRDVTEQKRLETSREEAFSAVSHEMRTPLTAVLGFAQFMEENATSPEQQRKYLGLIVREGERLKRLIDNLLSLQRLRAGFGLVSPAPVWIYPLMYEVAEHYRTPLVSQRVEIDCLLDLPPVLGESVRLQEAVTNLLDNAVKYSPPESTIVLGGETDGDRVLLWVRNQGSSIPAEEQEKIFGRFYRLQGHNRPAGTGLGLALVREIAHAHGGRVWVDSDPGATTFFLSLPLAP